MGNEVKLPAEVTNYPAVARRIVVKDVATYDSAADAIKSLKEFKNKIVAEFAPMKKAAQEAHKAVCAKEKEYLAPIEEAETHVRGQMNTFLQAQERIRQEEERKLRLEAEEKARKEREKLAAQEEKARAAGKEDKADALAEKAEAVYVAPVYVAPTMTGNTTSKLVVEVLDLPTFINALCAANSSMTMIEVSPSKLTAWVKANGLEKFPGLRIEKTLIATVR